MALQAPFGTDEQPSLAVKIVGSKAFEVKARNGGVYDSLSRTPYKYSSRPPWYLDDATNEAQKSNNKVHLTSISNSPFFSPREQSISNREAKIHKERNGATCQIDSSADSMLSRLLSEYPSSKFKEIYTDMAEYDPRLSGYISENQVETSLRRHKLPIPSTVLKLALPPFYAEHNATMVNYESLIKYLFSFSLKTKQSHVRKPSDEMKLDLNHVLAAGAGGLGDPSMTARSDQSSNLYVSPRSLVKKAMDDREEAYLLVQIEQTFKTSGPQILDILQKLHNDLSKLSNGAEYIKTDQIERTCSWLRVPLHHTLLGKILNRFDVKRNDKINWAQFIAFLKKGVPLSIQQSCSLASQKSTARSPLPFWERQTPLAPVQVSPRKESFEKQLPQMKEDKGKEHSTNGISNIFPKERKKWDTSNVNDHYNKHPENKLRPYDILKVENNRHNESGGSTKTPHCDMVESRNSPSAKPDTTASENVEDKLERFSHLTEALLRSDVDKNGTLNTRDVLRIISNYNLIYNLHFPGDKVQKIIQSCTLEGTNEVVIEDLARSLWNLIK